MHEYEVVMGRYGSVYSGSNRRRARRKYRAAVRHVAARGLGYTVVMFRDGDVVREYDGELVKMSVEVS